MDASVNEVEDTLYRLLHHRSYRAGVRNGTLVLPAPLQSIFATMDWDELERVADEVLRGVLARAHRGSGGLEAMYPRTIAAWRASHPDDAALHELTALFMESEAYARHRELPHGEGESCLEEAFYRFAEHAKLGDAAVREDEYLSSLLRALTICPTPAFSIPREVRRLVRGFAAVSRGDAPVLHAACDGRYLRGPITPFLAALVMTDDEPVLIANRLGIKPETLAATLRELETMGLRKPLLRAA